MLYNISSPPSPAPPSVQHSPGANALTDRAMNYRLNIISDYEPTSF